MITKLYGTNEATKEGCRSRKTSPLRSSARNPDSHRADRRYLVGKNGRRSSSQHRRSSRSEMARKKSRTAAARVQTGKMGFTCSGGLEMYVGFLPIPLFSMYKRQRGPMCSNAKENNSQQSRRDRRESFYCHVLASTSTSRHFLPPIGS